MGGKKKTNNVIENGWGLQTQIFLYLEAFECNTTSDWLNHSQSEVVLHSYSNLVEKKRQRMLGEWLVNTGPAVRQPGNI